MSFFVFPGEAKSVSDLLVSSFSDSYYTSYLEVSLSKRVDISNLGLYKSFYVQTERN